MQSGGETLNQVSKILVIIQKWKYDHAARPKNTKITCLILPESSYYKKSHVFQQYKYHLYSSWFIRGVVKSHIAISIQWFQNLSSHYFSSVEIILSELQEWKAAEFDHVDATICFAKCDNSLSVLLGSFFYKPGEGVIV